VCGGGGGEGVDCKRLVAHRLVQFGDCVLVLDRCQRDVLLVALARLDADCLDAVAQLLRDVCLDLC